MEDEICLQFFAFSERQNAIPYARQLAVLRGLPGSDSKDSRQVYGMYGEMWEVSTLHSGRVLERRQRRPGQPRQPRSSGTDVHEEKNGLGIADVESSFPTPSATRLGRILPRLSSSFGSSGSRRWVLSSTSHVPEQRALHPARIPPDPATTGDLQ